jgi:hypothetical protein
VTDDIIPIAPDADEPPLDARWLDAARRYHAAPRVPRAEMWAAIAGARGRSPAQGPRARPASRPRAFAVGWAAAAALLLAIGYGAGRTLPAPGGDGGTAGGPGAEATSDGLYAIAATSHFAKAEALLTQFKGAAAAERADTALGTWARDLLAETRFLLDSPAADDPARRTLLLDLELVLVQIVRLRGAGHDEDRSLTADALRDADVLLKLRTAVPSGAVPRA